VFLVHLSAQRIWIKLLGRRCTVREGIWSELIAMTKRIGTHVAKFHPPRHSPCYYAQCTRILFDLQPQNFAR